MSGLRPRAEVVGHAAADALSRLSYDPLTLDIDPPKRGGERPDGWRDAVDALVETIALSL